MLRHQLENLRRPAVAVFDGFNSSQNRPRHPFGRRGVHRYRHSGAFCGLYCELYLFERKCRMRAGMGAPAIVGVEFDPIGAVADLVAHYADQAVDAVGLFGALGDAPFLSVTLGAVGAGGYDGAGGG